MKLTFASIGAAAVVLTAGAASANGEAEQCFDKGTLTYFDCPTAEVVDDGSFYIGARGGLAFIDEISEEVGGTVDIEYDTGYLVSAMVGYDAIAIAPGVGFRPELEIGYMAADIAEGVDDGSPGSDDFDGDTSVLFGFVNAFVDLDVVEGVQLFATGGVGFGQVDMDFTDVSNGSDEGGADDSVFGWNLGAGAAVEVAEGMKLEAMYRYMSFGGVEAEYESDNFETDVDAHTATVGLRVEF